MDYKCLEVDVSNKASLDYFLKFYNDILLESFPSEQIESYDQLLDTLNKKKNGFFGKNSYHILIIYDNENILGGIIYDYFIDSNTGMIEYIATSKKYRKAGIASYAFSIACKNLNETAVKNGYSSISFICCELEKVIFKEKSNHYFWKKFGFKKLDFDYIQPSLDKGKPLVRDMTLGIITNSIDAPFYDSCISKDILKSILYDYSYYTMRIENPKKEQYFIEMMKQLDKKGDFIYLI